MNTIILTRYGYFVAAALLIGAIALTDTHAQAGNAYGKEDNPGQAKGHAENGGPATPGEANANGKLTAAMGSLNAAHAAPKAFENANPRSRVGALAAYMDAMAAYSQNHEAYEDLMAEIEAIDAELAAIADQVAALDPDAEGYETELTALGEQISALEQQKESLMVEAEEVSQDLAVSAGDAAEALKSAANKNRKIDAEVIDAINRLLDGKSEGFTHDGAVHEAEQKIVTLINTQ